MTEVQGDYLGCVIVLLGIAPLILAVNSAERRDSRLIRAYVVMNVICSIVGVAVVILT